ncbi:MAG: hypothetical protein QOG63_325, partial [Thermoleophilaceae bacterium]|nr:hypothetical protein [Thermoleophilaceae bacterium]
MPLTDLACVVHLHTTHSDGTGSVADVVRAARRNALDVVLLTDHDTLGGQVDEGWHDDVLLLVGEEVSPFRHDHTLVFGVSEPLDWRDRPIADVVAAAPLAFAAHPFSGGSARFPSFGPGGMPHSTPFAPSITGIELWSFVTDTAEQAASLGELWRFLTRPERALRGPPARNLIEWDRACARRRVVAIGGLDIHQVGVRVGGRVPLRLMSYARAFRYLRTHVLVRSQPTGSLAEDRAAVYEALGEGRCYMAVDAFAPARGFAYWAEGGLDMGAEAAFGGQALHVRLPRPAEIRLLRAGEQVASVADAATL